MSTIDWLQGGPTVNWFTGCRQGCAWCYARPMAYRLAHIAGTVYQRVGRAMVGRSGRFVYPTGGDHFAPAVHLDVRRAAEERLARRRKPQRVFVGSMGDLCFEGPALAWGLDGEPLAPRDTGAVQAEVAAFARRLPQHTVLALTKRPDLLDPTVVWPRNVHLGVSVTRTADAARIVTLRRWAAAKFTDRPGVLWASVEPMLDPAFDPAVLAGLAWVVVGLGTGRATPRGPDRDGLVAAARRIVAWCADHGVPCWCKDSLRACGDAPWPRALPLDKRATS